MSKYVKDLVTTHFKTELDGITEALLLDIAKLDAVSNNVVRKRLFEKGMRLMVVKNSLARRATLDSPLASAFEGVIGPLAVVFGGEDIVTMAKEVVALQKEAAFAAIEAKGGVLDGEKLSSDEVTKISKWPSRQEQLSLLAGQILGPGATLSAQLIGPGGSLASQIKQKSEEDEE